MGALRDGWAWGRGLALAGLLGASCAGPSRGQLEERAAEARRLTHAHAVYMPPAEVESCVGVVLRLSEETPGSEEERLRLEARLTDEEAARALQLAGLEACGQSWGDALREAGLTPEPLQLRMAYGVDPNGRVCAVVQRTRPEPLDPSAAAFLDGAVDCMKEAVLRARFPAGRVEDRERVVRFAVLAAELSG